MIVNLNRMGYVRLIDYMGNDLSVVNAARASFEKSSSYLRKQDARLIEYLVEHGHTSPFRHVVMTLEIQAPMMVARQWFKYRVGSRHTADTGELVGEQFPASMFDAGNGDDGGEDTFQARNEASRRYVQTEPAFYLPKQWRQKPTTAKQGSGGPVSPVLNDSLEEELLNFYQLAMMKWREAIEAGVAPEQARLFLPGFAMLTTWRWTCSLDAAVHFLKQRLHDDAQWEIQQYAQAVKTILSDKFPVSMKALFDASK